MSLITRPIQTTRRPVPTGVAARVPLSTYALAAGAIAVALGVGAALVRVFLHSWTGADWDTRLMGILGGPPEAFGRIMSFVQTVSPMTVALTLLVSMGIAAARRRFAVAAATGVLVVGATLTTQVLKYQVLDRVGGLANALPSGHSTAALLWALGAVFVVPRSWRPVVTLGGTVVACTIGVGTIAGRWHRPSDVVAAAMVCLGWAAGAVLLASLLQRGARPRSGRPLSVYLGIALVATVATCGVFFGLGFTLAGQGLTQLGALMVLFSVAAAGASTICFVAWFADRELG